MACEYTVIAHLWRKYIHMLYGAHVNEAWLVRRPNISHGSHSNRARQVLMPVCVCLRVCVCACWRRACQIFGIICVCVCMCVSVWLFVCVCVCVCECVSVSVCVCVSYLIFGVIPIHIHIYEYVYILCWRRWISWLMSTHVYIKCVYVCVYINAYTNTYMWARIFCDIRHPISIFRCTDQ